MERCVIDKDCKVPTKFSSTLYALVGKIKRHSSKEKFLLSSLFALISLFVSDHNKKDSQTKKEIAVSGI
jgi:hypothetical protein